MKSIFEGNVYNIHSVSFLKFIILLISYVFEGWSEMTCGCLGTPSSVIPNADQVVKFPRRHRESHQGQTVTLRHGYARLRWSWRKSVDRSHGTVEQRRRSADAFRAPSHSLSCWFHRQYHDQKQPSVPATFAIFIAADWSPVITPVATRDTKITVRPKIYFFFFNRLN